jgi:NAD(P)-dependent dehydrogenase (short-subunit alcohol dehydrogenase family)
LDLSDLKSVHAFTEEFSNRNLPLHVLLNNAGIMACPFELSADGIESQFATNHVGHFYLTLRLLPILEKSQPSRIVNVSSEAHRMASASDFDDISNPSKYSRLKAYGRSKLANILFSNELSKRLEARGVDKVFVNSIHPGVVKVIFSLIAYTDWFRETYARVYEFHCRVLPN